jgi:hypothetical protein
MNASGTTPLTAPRWLLILFRLWRGDEVLLLARCTQPRPFVSLFERDR